MSDKKTYQEALDELHEAFEALKKTIREAVPTVAECTERLREFNAAYRRTKGGK